MPDIKTVLLVDDDETNRKLLSTIIRISKKNFKTLEAKNGVEALNVLKNNAIDLILLDIIMPIMNGLEFLQEIKREHAFSKIPVIILTTDDTKKNKAKELGANDVLIKPVRPVILLETMDKYI